MERLILRKGNGMMKKPISVFLAVLMILAIGAPASAEMTHQNPVYELYSAEGVYTDSVGNEGTYSYHVPQIFADSPAADEINAEIAAARE